MLLAFGLENECKSDASFEYFILVRVDVAPREYFLKKGKNYLIQYSINESRFQKNGSDLIS